MRYGMKEQEGKGHPPLFIPLWGKESTSNLPKVKGETTSLPYTMGCNKAYINILISWNVELYSLNSHWCSKLPLPNAGITTKHFLVLCTL